jgi:FkbM family methyltransferase
MGQSFAGRVWKGLRGRLKKTYTNPYQMVDISWGKLKYLKHLSNGKERVHVMHGHQLFYTSATELLHGLKEIFIEEIYRQDLGPEPYIIDCGANIGLSVIYLKEKYPEAKIIAFEPDETNAALLKKNIGSFGFKNVEIRKEAVWIEDTELNFSSDSSMSSRIDENAKNTIRVKATRLRDLLDRQVDFLKIDIEGAEYRVMMDIADRLSMVRNLFLEYHGSFSQAGELTQILQKLTANNFHFYIKEAAPVHAHPFLREKDPAIPYDVQLNIFCQKNDTVNG